MRWNMEYADDYNDVHLYTEDSRNLDAVAEYCKRRQIDGDVGDKDIKLVASVPDFFVQKYLNDNKITLREFARDKGHQDRLLSDPAIAHFRIWRGRL